MTRAVTALLVDPSLFTAPYDAALTAGLVSAGVEPTWAVRPLRQGDRQEIPTQYVDAFFYSRTDGATFLPKLMRKAAKGLAHVVGLSQLFVRVLRRRPDIVHFQWVVVPPLDALAIKLLGCVCPVVLTVHDTVPFNGDRTSLLQNLAFDVPIRAAHRVIVHTQEGRKRLLELGVPAQKVVVIPHGPLPLPQRTGEPVNRERLDHRYTFVMFGEIKRYKGPELVVEAAGMLPPRVRAQARFIIAGRPQMDTAPILARIDALSLGETVQVWPRRLSDSEMADLFAETDCFLFPYRQVDASGVYFLTKSLGKWIIASRVGVFAEDMQEHRQGALIAPGDARALAEAVARAVMERPVPTSRSSSADWVDIGRATRRVYEQAGAGLPTGARGDECDLAAPPPTSSHA
jgi:glycosyltransferase involved in cell wall biosynthesis